MQSLLQRCRHLEHHIVFGFRRAECHGLRAIERDFQFVENVIRDAARRLINSGLLGDRFHEDGLLRLFFDRGNVVLGLVLECKADKIVRHLLVPLLLGLQKFTVLCVLL